jgi:hypothetical protein
LCGGKEFVEGDMTGSRDDLIDFSVQSLKHCEIQRHYGVVCSSFLFSLDTKVTVCFAQGDEQKENRKEKTKENVTTEARAYFIQFLCAKWV